MKITMIALFSAPIYMWYLFVHENWRLVGDIWNAVSVSARLLVYLLLKLSCRNQVFNNQNANANANANVLNAKPNECVLL